MYVGLLEVDEFEVSEFEVGKPEVRNSSVGDSSGGDPVSATYAYCAECEQIERQNHRYIRIKTS